MFIVTCNHRSVLTLGTVWFAGITASTLSCAFLRRTSNVLPSGSRPLPKICNDSARTYLASAGSKALLGLALALTCSACVSIGPPAISNGRMAYNEVINYTEDQQVLNAIVRDRYGLTFSLLSVSSITANVKFRSSVETQFEAWADGASVDSLIPLSIGAGYEDNPTISYSPVQGELVLRQLTSPIGVDEGFLLMSFARDREIVNRYVYKRINEHFIPAVGSLPDAIARMQKLNSDLYDSGIVQFGLAPDSDADNPRYVLTLSSYNDAEAELIREYLDLLGVDADRVDGDPILIPIGPNSVDSDENSLSVMTRSVYAWMRLAGSMIELPPPHVREGIVEPDDNWTGPSSDRLITIRSSPDKPDDAAVAIPFKDWWFYISETDTRSKDSFRLIKLLFSLRLNPEGSGGQIPVLTVPIN